MFKIIHEELFSNFVLIPVYDIIVSSAEKSESTTEV